MEAILCSPEPFDRALAALLELKPTAEQAEEALASVPKDNMRVACTLLVSALMAKEGNMRAVGRVVATAARLMEFVGVSDTDGRDIIVVSCLLLLYGAHMPAFYGKIPEMDWVAAAACLACQLDTPYVRARQFELFVYALRDVVPWKSAISDLSRACTAFGVAYDSVNLDVLLPAERTILVESLTAMQPQGSIPAGHTVNQIFAYSEWKVECALKRAAEEPEAKRQRTA